LQEVYTLGGRKIAFQNALAGPLGCVPKATTMNTQMGGGFDEVLSASNV